MRVRSTMKNSRRQNADTPERKADSDGEPGAGSRSQPAGTDTAFGFVNDSWLGRLRAACKDNPLDQVGSYEVLDVCARGGQGTVYRCRRTDGRLVALKRIHGGVGASRVARERLLRELEVATKLSHSSIVPVRPVDLPDDLAIEMDWIEGVPFIAWARGVNNTNSRVHEELLAVLQQICDAVQHAHDYGVVHRDLKPSNILVDRHDQPHILDFGIARPLGDFSATASQLTFTDQLLGTPAYASPEQVAGTRDEIDARSDVYSLGVLMYEAFTGVGPYPPSLSLGRLLSAVELMEPMRPRSIDRAIPRDIEAVILKALRKRREDRYSSVRALREDLRRCAAGQAPQAERPNMLFDVRFFTRRHPILTGLTVFAAAFVLIAVTLVSIYAVRLQHARNETLAAHQAAERVNDLLTNLLFATEEFSDPTDSRLTRLLDDADKWVPRELAGDPWALARAQVSFGRMYGNLQQWQKAEYHLAAALNEYRGLGKSDRTNVADALSWLGLAQAYLGNAQSVATQREALSMIERLEPPSSRNCANYYAALGESLLVTSSGSNHAEADEYYSRAFQLTEGIPGWQASLMISKARALVHVNALDEALVVLRTAKVTFESDRANPTDRNYRQCLTLLLDVLSRLDMPDEALPIRQRLNGG